MLKPLSQALCALSLASLLALTTGSGLRAAELSAAEEQLAQQLHRSQQVYMYLELLEFLLVLSEGYENACNHQPCKPEALTRIREEAEKRYPIGAMLLETTPELTAHDLKKVLGETDFKRLNDALRAYAQSVKQIRTMAVAEPAPLKAVWNEMLGEQDPYRRAVQSSVKANMHTLQTIVETYAVDWGGVYADSLGGLYAEANLSGREYWKDFTNPYTGKSGIGTEGSLIDYPAYRPMPWAAGMVIYMPIVEAGGYIIKYYIYGTDKNGQLIKDKGQDFVLTNS